ncbi:hypothetical protein LEP1GSC077_4586, partial [Leptospira interrogans str. C10069]
MKSQEIKYVGIELWKKTLESHTDRRQLSSSKTTIFNNRNW